MTGDISTVGWLQETLYVICVRARTLTQYSVWEMAWPIVSIACMLKCDPVSPCTQVQEPKWRDKNTCFWVNSSASVWWACLQLKIVFTILTRWRCWFYFWKASVASVACHWQLLTRGGGRTRPQLIETTNKMIRNSFSSLKIQCCISTEEATRSNKILVITGTGQDIRVRVGGKPLILQTVLEFACQISIWANKRYIPFPIAPIIYLMLRKATICFFLRSEKKEEIFFSSKTHTTRTRGHLPGLSPT